MAPGRESAKRILFVEDDADVRETVALVLAQEGYVVRTAENGQEALEQLRREPAELILLDLMMPVMNGWEFRRQQRQDPALASIPVVVVSAAGEAAEEADALGDVGYLQKPIDFQQLLALMEHFVAPQKPEILLVENEPRVLLLLDRMLRHRGFATHLAMNGREALDTYERNRGKIALVLMDVQMPKMDGVQALAALRQADPGVRVALMNDNTGRHTNEALQELGAVRVFQKPFMKFAEVAESLWGLLDGASARSA